MSNDNLPPLPKPGAYATWMEGPEMTVRTIVGYTVDQVRQAQRDAVAASGAGVPAGYALVPIEITDDMVVAFCEAWYSTVRCFDDPEMQDAYAAMIAARPDAAGSGNALDFLDRAHPAEPEHAQQDRAHFGEIKNR